MTNARKMNLLRDSLTGEAALELLNFPTRGENYLAAVDRIAERFGRGYKVAASVINSLVNTSRITTTKSADIRKLACSITTHTNALKAFEGNLASALLVAIVEQKILDHMRATWRMELDRKANNAPSAEHFTAFLATQATAFETVRQRTASNAALDAPKKKPSGYITSAGAYHSATGGDTFFDEEQLEATTSMAATARIECPLCQQNHSLAQYAGYLERKGGARYALVQQKDLCHLCLFADRKASQCRYSKCQQCQGLHNSTLYQTLTSGAPLPGGSGNPGSASRGRGSRKNQKNSKGPRNTQAPQDNPPENEVTASMLAQGNKNLLMTTLVNVLSVTGTLVTARALLDSGSQVSFITRDLAVHLGLDLSRQTKLSLALDGTEPSKPVSTPLTSCQIQSKHQEFQLNVEALVIPAISHSVPTSEFLHNQWQHLRDLELADPEIGGDGHIQLLLGVEAFAQLIDGPTIKPPPGEAASIAWKTPLGYVLSGKVPAPSSADPISSNPICVFHNTPSSRSFGKSRTWRSEAPTARRNSKSLPTPTSASMSNLGARIKYPCLSCLTGSKTSANPEPRRKPSSMPSKGSSSETLNLNKNTTRSSRNTSPLATQNPSLKMSSTSLAPNTTTCLTTLSPRKVPTNSESESYLTNRHPPAPA